MFRIVTSTSAASRLGAAIQFLDRRPSSSEVLVVGASRGAADDLVRAVAVRRGATIGLSRFSVTELAARAAASGLASERRAPASDAGAEALAARIVFDAVGARELAYFAPVAEMPGFPRALARTLYELRLARVTPAGLEGRGPAAADIGRLLARMEEELARAATADRASLFHMAADAWRAGIAQWAGLPVLLLDVAINSRAEREFIAEVVAHAPDALATVPDDDARTVAALSPAAAALEELPDSAQPASDLFHLRRYVFTSGTPPERSRAGDVRLFSAPGEGREALEIARRLLMEAKAGVPFDEMAVFLRAPQQYLGLLDHACARAGVPVYFDRGTRRPDPAGRAFVALLSSAVEGLSAKRFDEYLSLGQVPSGAPRSQAVPALPRDEVFAELIPDLEADAPDDDEPAPMDSESDAILAGTLRAPWKWEELIVESAVVGGRGRRDGKERWRRRLDGLSNDYSYRRDELRREEPDSPRLARLARDLREPRSSSRVCAAAHRRRWRDGLMRRHGVSGSICSRPWRRARWRVRIACSACLRTFVRWLPSARYRSRKHATSSTIVSSRSIGIRRPGVTVGVRGHAASGARARVSRRLRSGPGRASGAAASAGGSAASRRTSPRYRRRSCTTGGAGRRGAPAVENCDRRGGRTPVSLVSAHGRRRNTRARAIVLRARRRPRDHRPRARLPGTGGSCRSGGRRDARVAGAERPGAGRSTISNTTSPCSSRFSSRATAPRSRDARITCSG